MSFYSFRDRPRLSERIRGKSGDELMKELRKELDQDRKMFFEPNPNWGPAGSTFPRAGHFDDNMMRGHMDMRSHLDDLAQRHPEFAEHLRWPPCSGDVRSNTWGRKRRGSGEDSGEASTKQQQQQQPQPQHSENTNFEQETTEEPGPLRGRPKENLRNTVPDMGQKQQDNDEKEGRGQRSWSAPPDNRTQQPQDKPQRFVSKIEITPVNPAASQDQQTSGSSAPTTTGDAAKPPMPPKQQPQQQQHTQPQHKQSTVRHIPIFVEGRDEPILPRNVEQEFTQTQAPPPSYHHPQYTPHNQFQHQQAPPPPPPPPQPQKQEPKPQPQKQEPKTQKSEQQHQPKQPEPPINANDPISRVQIIQKEVSDLRNKIENFKGSRTDKEYIYLDEMLTRNLLKLDNIDTEGKENVRAARKEAIKSIQRCISILESNAPVQGRQEVVDDSVQQNTSDKVQSETKDEKMDTTPVTTDTPAPSNEQQNNENKMETDNTNKTQSDSKNVEPESSTDKEARMQESEKKVPEESKMEVENQPNSAAGGQEQHQDPSSTTSS